MLERWQKEEHTWVGRDKGASLYAASCIVEVPDLVEGAAAALDVDIDSSRRFQSCEDF